MMNRSTDLVATLRHVEGNAVDLAELAKVLEMYNYQQSADDPRIWELVSDEPADKGARVRVGDEGRSFEVFTMSAENIENLHYVASRAGWTALKAICAAPTVKALVEAQFVHVEAICEVDEQAGGPTEAAVISSAASLRAGAALKERHAGLSAQSGLTSSVFEHETAAASDLARRFEEVVAALERAELAKATAEARLAMVLAEKDALCERVLRLEHQSPALAGSSPSAGVLRFLEKHVVGKLGPSGRADAEMLAELRAIGLDVAIKIVPVAS